MKTILLTVFGVISCLFGLGFLLYALYLYREGRRAKQVLSSIQVYTIGVFISVVMLFIPIYYTSYNFGDIYKFFRPFLIAVHNSLRIFILDGDFDIIVNSLSGQKTALRVCFSLYAAFLYVIAPILTFGNVLSLFKNIRGELRYKWSNKKAYYVMSELNEKSIALAKSIFKEYQNKGNLKNISIVFMDVFEQNEEDDYETLTEARDIDAICLKKDISHLDITSKKGTVELFLIGNDESENVSQAVKITKDLNQKNKKQNVKVFVFSTKPSAAYIVDSIKYDNLLDFAAKHEYSENCFKLRRINEKQQLIWNTVPQMKLFELADRANKTLSVMILGFGSYGIEFFKMLIWFCQFEGYKLRVNIIDKLGKSSDEKDRVESLINRDCPELLKKNRTNVMGEAQYDIEIFPGVDVMSSDIGDILLYDGKDERMKYASERLKSTNLVFVSLGDDDRNIEVAIHMRHLFDRVNGVKER